MKVLKKHLVIIDSPSECGKTSLCLHLATKYRFNYYHIKRWNHPLESYEIDILDFAFENIAKWESNFVIERMHLSDEVYGKVLNSQDPYKNWENFNQHIINKCERFGINYTLVTCLPPKDKVTFTNTLDNQLYDGFEELYNNNQDKIYNYNFVDDPDYIKIDEYLENK